MQAGQRIYRDCRDCSGTGIQYRDPSGSIQSQNNRPDSTQIDCPSCVGLGIAPWGWLRDEKEETMPGEEA